LPTLTEGKYIDLVDYTGRQVYPRKRGMIRESEPKALDKLGLNAAHWAHRVQGFAEGFGDKWFRVIGELEDMIEKALEIKQRTLFAIGLARHLNFGGFSGFIKLFQCFTKNACPALCSAAQHNPNHPTSRRKDGQRMS